MEVWEYTKYQTHKRHNFLSVSLLGFADWQSENYRAPPYCCRITARMHVKCDGNTPQYFIVPFASGHIQPHRLGIANGSQWMRWRFPLSQASAATKYYIVLCYKLALHIGALAEWLTRCPAIDHRSSQAFPSGACVRITQASVLF